MTIEMYNLINTYYTELFNDYCKYKTNNIINSLTNEDIFHEKILAFMESDIKLPTLELLKLFIKTKKCKRSRIITCEYKEQYDIIEETEEEKEIKEKIKLLFIDYRPENKK